MNEISNDYDVLVVGAGPTGLTVGNILGMHDVRTLLVERNAATVSEPRAVSIDDESLRTMQYIDLAGEVCKSIIAGYGSHYFSSRRSCFAKVIPDVADYGYPRRSAFRQPVLERQLRAGLQRFSSVETRFSTKVAELCQNGQGVVGTLTTASGLSKVRARYVVAADGARSGIREALGIRMGGSTFDQQWLIVDLAGSTDRFRHTRVYCDPSRPALALPGPDGTRRYELMMLPGEKAEELVAEERVRELLSHFSADDARLQIVRKVVYHFHARIADRWSGGLILLAGDAAHLSPPFAGQGMNSGIRDAHNLAWKLAWCVNGKLGSGVLDSYEAERKPHAAALIQMAVNMGRVMMPRSRLNALAVQTAFRVLGLYRPARDYMMQMKYKPQPHFERGLLVGEAGLALRGRMLPQPLVELRDGEKVMLDYVLGKGFAVVELDNGACPLTPPRSDRALSPTLIRVIPRDHRFVGSDKNDENQVRDVTGALGAMFEHADIRGVVVRPDRYVAAAMARSSSAAEADRLLEELVRLSKTPSQVAQVPEQRELAIA
jgi:3-(3-hydroxy-phenyl)propionate hydroxylase